MSNEVPKPVEIFDEKNRHWSNARMQNRLFIQAQQNWTLDKLLVKGFVTLNEAYESLGFPLTEEGALSGWVGDVDVKFVADEELLPTEPEPFELRFNINSNNVFADMQENSK